MENDVDKEKYPHFVDMLWIYFSGVRYALRYEHHNQAIELREQNNQGRLVASIDNTTPITQIIELFQSL